MPVSKPSELPEWADGGGADITDPPTLKKQTGWVVEQPAHDVFNWWMNLVYQWIQWINDLQDQAFTWTAGQIFSALAHFNAGLAVASGLTVTGGTTTDSLTVTGATTLATPTFTTPSLSVGSANSPKLCYWKDASGAVHIEGSVNLTGVGVIDATVWASGAIASGSRPTNTIVVPAEGVTTGATRGACMVTVNTNGSLVCSSKDGTNLAGGFWVNCVYHPSAPH